MIEYYNEDCMELMARYPDNYFNLAIVDPPYGININMNMGLKKGMKKKREQKDWDGNIPDKKYFDELFRVSKNQVIWGGNYFTDYLPPTRGFIIWDKGESMYGRSFAECEFAFTSFDTSARIFKLNPIQSDRLHPTQKPVALYKWLLKNYAKPNDIILDTHVGSASSLIACHDMVFDAVGCELDLDYFTESTKRLEYFTKQPKLEEIMQKELEQIEL